jgi:hypothetical protein
MIFALKTAKDLPHHFFRDISFLDPLPSGLLDPIFVKSNKTRIEIWTDQNREQRPFNIFEIEQNLPVFVQSGEIFSDTL